jgi:GIY-YIG catalytic domain-containing protein
VSLIVPVQRFTVYCYTNVVTGKKYVGQTKQGRDERWSQHLRKDCIYPFALAIREHGPDVWSYEVLDVVTTRKGAYIAEARWIDHFGCRVPNGYNVYKGNVQAAGGLVPSRARFYEKLIKCGKVGCLGCPHGPYLYAKWDEHGETRNAYIGKVDASRPTSS